MKRTGADLRKRTTTTIESETRPVGPLTEEELEAVRRAYADGCQGDVIIGMRGDERVITMLIPEDSLTSPEDKMVKVREQIKILGCDGMQRVRRV